MEQSLVVYSKEIVDYGVIGVLALMSLVSLWLFIERMMFYKTVDVKNFKSYDELDIKLTDNLNTISTIGANAPYIGLLGTVFGIMITFYSMGDVATIDPKEIMRGLALALKATAMGLIVAIPAIVFYNILLRKVEKILAKFEMENGEA